MEILIGFVVILVISIIILSVAGYNDGLQWAGFVGCSISSLGLIVIGITLVQSTKTANFLNANFGTNYTREDIFWNEDLIRSQLKIDDKIIDNSSRIKVEMKK